MINLLGMLLIFASERRCLNDDIAGTVVVALNRPEAESGASVAARNRQAHFETSSAGLRPAP
jgi:hypothetical protein